MWLASTSELWLASTHCSARFLAKSLQGVRWYSINSNTVHVGSWMGQTQDIHPGDKETQNAFHGKKDNPVVFQHISCHKTSLSNRFVSCVKKTEQVTRGSWGPLNLYLYFFLHSCFCCVYSDRRFAKIWQVDLLTMNWWQFFIWQNNNYFILFKTNRN